MLVSLSLGLHLLPLPARIDIFREQALRCIKKENVFCGFERLDGSVCKDLLLSMSLRPRYFLVLSKYEIKA